MSNSVVYEVNRCPDHASHNIAPNDRLLAVSYSPGITARCWYTDPDTGKPCDCTGYVLTTFER